jgi:hypothetical protein
MNLYVRQLGNHRKTLPPNNRPHFPFIVPSSARRCTSVPIKWTLARLLRTRNYATITKPKWRKMLEGKSSIDFRGG